MFHTRLIEKYIFLQQLGINLTQNDLRDSRFINQLYYCVYPIKDQKPRLNRAIATTNQILFLLNK
jgi:hypothetical protein